MLLGYLKKHYSSNTYKSTTYPINSKIIQKKLQKNLAISEKGSNFATQTRNNDVSKEFEANLKQGAIAQLVEQRTENPCVPGSIPGGTTFKIANNLIYRLLAIFHSTQIGRVTYKVTYNTTL